MAGILRFESIGTLETNQSFSFQGPRFYFPYRDEIYGSGADGDWLVCPMLRSMFMKSRAK